MPSDPQECRQHAERYRRLATEARTVAACNKLLNLAVSWERLATELEAVEPFTKAMDEIRPPMVAPWGVE